MSEPLPGAGRNGGRARVAHLATVHPPFDMRVYEKHCRSLAAAGYDVTFITAHDGDATREGVTIKGVPKPSRRMERLTRVLPAVLRSALREDADVYHFHDVELILAGFVLKLRGKKVIYDVHENYPEDVFREKPYLPVWVRHALAWSVAGAERLADRWFDAIVTATGVIGARFDAGKTTVVRNYARVEELQQGVTLVPYAERRPVALFTGGLTPIRCGAELCVMSDRLRDIPGYETVVLGRPDTPAYPAQLAARPGWDRVRYEGIVPMARVREQLGAARVGLLLNQPREDYVDLATNKLFEYMAVGLPVVSTGIPFWQKIVTETGCGIVVEGADAGQLADAVRWLLEHPAEAQAMGERGRQAALERYNWASEERALLAVYDRVLA